MDAKTVMESACGQGVKSRTLERAKKWLGVRSVREGFGVGGKIHWALDRANPRVEVLASQYGGEREADD